MDKTSGFALIGFLCIVLGFGFSRAMAGGGGGGGGGVVMAGGGGGGGGGDVCSLAIAKLRQCQGAMLNRVPEEYRDQAAAEFEEEMADAYGDCLRSLERKPESAAKVQACLQISDCEAFFRCL
ncbi:MAG: hypothetical protein JXB32_12920 [Deltaproteobacteria bacterium]|nr:hypothetical protein [Deltaproteobacteria bacterium]